MYKITQTAPGVLRIVDYPAGVAAALAALAGIIFGAWVSGSATEAVGLVIGVVVIVVFFGFFFQYRVSIFDRSLGLLMHDSRTLFFSTASGTYKFSELGATQTFKGSGGFAHASGLKIEVNGEDGQSHVVLADADMFPGHARKIAELKHAVDTWLDSV